MVAWNLSELANAAVNEGTQENKVGTPVEDPNSNDNTANKISIAIAHKFLSKTCPAFLARASKFPRSVSERPSFKCPL
jgi:L-lactate utilization protein LutC